MWVINGISIKLLNYIVIQTAFYNLWPPKCHYHSNRNKSLTMPGYTTHFFFCDNAKCIRFPSKKALCMGGLCVFINWYHKIELIHYATWWLHLLYYAVSIIGPSFFGWLFLAVDVDVRFTIVLWRWWNFGSACK